jgi:hypothetical protein
MDTGPATAFLPLFSSLFISFSLYNEYGSTCCAGQACLRRLAPTAKTSSEAPTPEAATETTTAKAVAKVTTTEASRPALETAARLLLAIRP